MNIVGILEACQYGDPADRVLAKTVNFAAQYGVNGVVQGQAGMTRAQAMVSNFRKMYGVPARGTSFIQAAGRVKRKP